MKRLVFPLVVTFLFWMLLVIGGEDIGEGSRARGLAVVAALFDWLLIEPMTLLGALAFVFVVTLFFTLVFPGDRQSDLVLAVPEEPDRGVQSGAIAGVMSQHSSNSSRGNGSQGIRSIRPAFGRAGSTGARNLLDIEIEKRALRENGLDWYFAHHGFEGRWEQVASQLNASGEVSLAKVLTEAGMIYDRWEAIRTSRDEGELTQDETNAYSAEIRPLDAEVNALLAT